MADPIRTFRHFREVPDHLWRWKNFSPAEIACRGTGQLKLHPEALDKLQALRDRLGKPLIVRSAYRSPAHNKAVKGAPRSKHMDGTAFDIAMANHDPAAFAEAPVKGLEGFNRSSPVTGPTYIYATIGGKRLRRGARLWSVATSTFKAEIYRFLRQERPTPEEMTAGASFPAGTVHLPTWADGEWLKQLTAEQMITVKSKRGFTKLECNRAP